MKKSDEEIIQQVLDGQVDAFSELVEKYQSAVYALAFHITKSFEDARDLAQEAFLKSYTSLETLRDKSKFAPWLKRITRSICLNWLKDREKERSLILPSRSPKTPDQELEAKLMREQILAALNSLSEPNQLTVTLYYMNGLSYQEIADFQGVPLSTVKGRLYESRKRLKKELVAIMDTTLKSEAPDTEFTRQIMEILGVVKEAQTGNPIPGAQVKMTRIGEAKTNADGIYRLENPEGYSGEEDIQVEAQGYATKFIPVVLSEEESIEGFDIQLERGASLVGRVVDEDGNPVAGAEVRLIISGYEHRVLTDAEGKYALKGLAPSPKPHQLWAHHEVFLTADAHVQISGPGVIAVPDIVLSRVTMVAVVGTVRDAEENPVEGARVYIVGEEGRILDGSETKTDSNGAYRVVGFPKTAAAVVVSAKGYAPDLKYIPTERADFTLEEGRTLTGQIVDEDGEPLEDVRVNVEWRVRFRLEERREYRNVYIDRSTQTDFNGHFRLEHLPEENNYLFLEITATRYGLVTYQKEVSEKTISSEREEGVIPPITMIQKGVIWGKVVDAETGKPIKRFRVKLGPCQNLRRWEGDISTPDIPVTLSEVGQTFYNRNGLFEIRLFQLRVAASITVSTEGYAPFELERVVATKSKTEPLLFKLQKSPPMRGVLLDANTSQPLFGATLFLFDGKRPIFTHPLHSGRAHEIGRAYSGADGTFTISEAEAEYLYISHAEYAPTFAAIRKEEDFMAIRLAKGANIVGKATPGQEIYLAILLDEEVHSDQMETTADANGDFQFKNLPVGLECRIYNRTHRQWGGPGISSTSNSRASFKLEAGETLTLDFRRKGNIRLFGKVTDADGNVYQNDSIKVEVKRLTAPQEQLEHSGSAISNEKGSYEILNLSPGIYSLQAHHHYREEKDRLLFSGGSIELKEGQKEVEYDVIFSKREPGVRVIKPEYLQMSKLDATSFSVQRCSAKDVDGAIWVIDKAHNTLVKLSAAGETLLKISPFNVYHSVGDRKMIAVDAKTGDCWICNFGKLTKVAKDIKEITEINYSDLGNGVVIDSSDGSVVVRLAERTIYGTGMLRFDPGNGRVIQILDGVSGQNLDINPKDRTIWLVGKNICKIKKEGETLFSLENIIGWCAADVSINPSDGTAWVAERDHPDVFGSQNRLIKVSASGEILKAIDMQFDPFSVSVDTNDGAVWVATLEGILMKFDQDGNLLKTIEKAGFSVRFDAKDGSCWVAGKGGIFKYSASGDLLASNTDFSDDQKGIAVI